MSERGSEKAGRAIVIGGGIVGVCSAYRLARRGFSVTLIEKDEPGQAASFGNSGSIGLASVPPLGMPGMLKDAPKMVLDKNHALVVRWRTLGQTLPWLLKFAKALDPTRVEAIGGARAALLSHVGPAYDSLLADIGHPELIYQRGIMNVYESDEAMRKARGGIELRKRHGIEVHEMTGDALRDLEPALSDRIACGVFFPAVRTSTEPIALTRAILEAFLALGGTLLRTTVRGFERGPSGVAAVLTEAGRQACDIVVLAAGAWSRDLARQLGDTVSLIAERGYHVEVPSPAPSLQIPLVSGEYNVSIVTMNSGLRMTTMAEFTSIDAPPDHARALAVFKRAVGVVRGANLDRIQTRWMGSRPSTPDSLPVIGRSPSARNVIYAFGHGHLGLTFGPVTASIVAQLAADEQPNIDISAYRPDRAFDGSHLAARAA